MARSRKPAKTLNPDVDAAIQAFVSALTSTRLSTQKKFELCDKAGEWALQNARAAVIDHVMQNTSSPSEAVH